MYALWTTEQREISFAENLSKALSVNPVDRATSGHTLAQLLAQSAANRLADNWPGSQRFLWGHGPLTDQMAQTMTDESMFHAAPRSRF
jgi:hypothetical protein